MSNETKWTPGPWAVKALENGIEHEIKRDGYFVATVHGSCVDEVKIGANARLIAAAPDLYEALENLLIVAPHDTPEEYNYWTQAKDALAKARGEDDAH